MILIALGANLPSPAGAPAETLRAALARLEGEGVRAVKLSSFYNTKAWPDPADPPFVNAVAVVESDLPPDALLATLHGIETAFGRSRSVKNAPRSLDLDLLDYDGRVQAGPPILPHPRIAERDFVLRPLAEIAPDWRHPVTGLTAGGMLARLAGDAAKD
jgi:2-amino-4-hydroxy-6-hydroxymethyldihydropteridine diphosphokinase